jgi:hypothetical protein
MIDPGKNIQALTPVFNIQALAQFRKIENLSGIEISTGRGRCLLS